MNSNSPAPTSVVKLAAGALTTATLALVLFVLPAEFDIDPTGLGEAMGIKGMSGYQVGALTTQTGGVYRDQSSFWLAPFESVEFKYTLAEGQSMVFDWRAKSAATADVIYEMHSEVDADPEQSHDVVVFKALRRTELAAERAEPAQWRSRWHTLAIASTGC